MNLICMTNVKMRLKTFVSISESKQSATVSTVEGIKHLYKCTSSLQPSQGCLKWSQASITIRVHPEWVGSSVRKLGSGQIDVSSGQRKIIQSAHHTPQIAQEHPTMAPTNGTQQWHPATAWHGEMAPTVAPHPLPNSQPWPSTIGGRNPYSSRYLGEYIIVPSWGVV